ncbi:MAG: SRPBCC domain-containing protein [Candidatus Thorarchaeota archaeon]|nr:SRPBCC domain-containing protein [Candidatus Thorarchaeota archaeon]
MDEQPVEDVMPVIHLSVRISRPLEEVWSSFLNPIIMTQWLGNEIRADMSEGGSIQFSGKNAPTTPEIDNFWTLKRFKEPQAILFSWGILGVATLFVIRFIEIPTGTQIDLKHGAIPDGAKPLHLSDHWNILLANFKSVVELERPAIKFDYTEYHPLRVTRYDPTDVRLSILINAPPQLPFDVWTNPEKLKHFIRATKPVVDRQYAGIYTWWSEGKGPVVFRKMEDEKEIEFTWVYGDEPETLVNIRFEEVEDKTLVTLHHHGFKNPEATIGYDVGWTSILGELKLVCELGESGITRVIDWE